MDDEESTPESKALLWGQICFDRGVTKHGFYVLAAVASVLGGVRQISLVMGPFSKWFARLAALGAPAIYYWPNIKAALAAFTGTGG